MSELSNVLKTLLKEHGLTVTELARRVGIAQPVIYRMASGETTDPKLGTLKPIAEFFQITLDQLAGLAPLSLKEDPINKVNQLPILSWESAINWPTARQQQTAHYAFSDQALSDNAYALVVSDTTMRPNFPEDTILMVDPDLSPQDQDLIIVHIAGQSKPLFKQLLFNGEHIYLCSLSPHFKPMEFNNRDRLTFLGVVKSAQINIK